ncbi:ABC-2 type transport system permease protein [Candidatus Kryptonium thompsonii]|nr:ABC transporter permease [Candidatus Kryptonium thompsoni]CUS76327.1 ABC-2 type transport system permease protein [Candidatus Kryptonium thompsoni]
MSSSHLQKIRAQALLNIISKEFTQLSRDVRSVIIIVLIPLFLLIVFGYGVTMDIKNVNLVICDFDRSEFSRNFIEKFISSGFFSLYDEVESIDAIDRYLISGKVKVGIIIPANFSNEVGAGRTVKVQIIIDGSDANTANVVLGYVQQIIQSFSSDIIANFIFKKTGKLISTVDLKPRVWFNPELKSVNFFIPGLMSLIMMIMTVLMTSLSISRERELGSFEKLISTPLSPFFIITGKAIPYAILAFFDSILILLAGRILFGLEVKGSLSLLLLITAVDLISGLNHILISGWHIGTDFIPTFESLLSMTAINLSITMLDINPIAIVAELALVPSIMIGSSTFSPLIIFLSKPCLNITTIFAVPLFST